MKKVKHISVEQPTKNQGRPQENGLIKTPENVCIYGVLTVDEKVSWLQISSG